MYNNLNEVKLRTVMYTVQLNATTGVLYSMNESNKSDYSAR